MYKIMIIEDDMTIARAIKDHLCKWDYQATFVTDFKNITEQLIRFEPHLVLLDVMLPFLMAFIGAVKYVRYLKFPLYLYPLPVTI